jgi:y4mF family transcriptional regulator
MILPVWLRAFPSGKNDPAGKMTATPQSATRISEAKQLGAAVRQRRRELGLTQEQIAGIAGVGVRFVSELERGKATAEIGKVLQVARRLGLDLWVAPRAGR